MLRKTNSQKGFTIIEVVITIAIGAAVMALVLNAVAGARRSQRNNARTSDISQIAGAINQYIANNTKLPDEFADIDQLVKLGHYTLAEINTENGWITAVPAALGEFKYNIAYTSVPVAGKTMLEGDPLNTADHILISNKAKCSAAGDNKLAAAGIREVAIAYWLEGQDKMNCLEI